MTAGQKTQARIRSKGGQFDTVTICEWNSNNNIIVDYAGTKCTAIYNVFAGCVYVDDIGGIL